MSSQFKLVSKSKLWSDSSVVFQSLLSVWAAKIHVCWSCFHIPEYYRCLHVTYCKILLFTVLYCLLCLVWFDSDIFPGLCRGILLHPEHCHGLISFPWIYRTKFDAFSDIDNIFDNSKMKSFDIDKLPIILKILIYRLLIIFSRYIVDPELRFSILL